MGQVEPQLRALPPQRHGVGHEQHPLGADRADGRTGRSVSARQERGGDEHHGHGQRVGDEHPALRVDREQGVGERRDHERRRRSQTHDPQSFD